MAVTSAVVVAVGVVIVFIGCVLLGRLFSPPTRCPKCRKRTMDWIDYHVLYDPAPARSLHRCRSCGAEMIYKDKTWIPRSEWPDEHDRSMFDELKGT
jgi:hypothetical protein